MSLNSAMKLKIIRVYLIGNLKSKPIRSWEIIHIDVFGNLITNISQNMLDNVNSTRANRSSSPMVTVGNISKSISYHITYGNAPVGSPVLTVGSSGFLELAVNQGSARKLFKANAGDRVIISYQDRD